MTKGGVQLDLMDDVSRENQIEEVLDRLLGPRSENALNFGLLGSIMPRLDVSKPNIHDTKAEFLVEKRVVSALVQNLDAAFSQIVTRQKDPEFEAVRDRLRVMVDAEAMKSIRGRKLENVEDLAFQNIVATGFFFNSLQVLLEMVSVYTTRLKELEQQEEEFWSVSHRPPNYYARTVALRLAKLYAREKNFRPTFGISSEGTHPSTDFGRALEEIFQILKIKASVKNAGSWAVSKLTEEDLGAPVNALAAYGTDLPPRPKPSRAVSGIVEALLNKPKA